MFSSGPCGSFPCGGTCRAIPFAVFCTSGADGGILRYRRYRVSARGAGVNADAGGDHTAAGGFAGQICVVHLQSGLRAVASGSAVTCTQVVTATPSQHSPVTNGVSDRLRVQRKAVCAERLLHSCHTELANAFSMSLQYFLMENNRKCRILHTH